MHIAIANVTNGGLSGGSRKYLDNVLSLIRNDPRVARLDALASSEAVAQLASTGETTGVESWPKRDPLLGFRWLRGRLRELNPDVIFIPTARWLPCERIPVVVMVRNMEPPLVPISSNRWPEALKNCARAWSAKRACQRAARVIAVSRFVDEFLVNKWHLPPGKVATIYHGMEEPVSRQQALRARALETMPDETFLFTAGSIRPARGLEDAIGALGILGRESTPPRLVIAGGVDPGMEYYKRRLLRLAASLGIEHRLCWAGRLTPREMSWCFYHCGMFVMTSRAEACPNTALEAMKHGCLNVSTDQPPMPEFYRDCAYYYRRCDPADLAGQISRALLADQADRQFRRARGKELASAFRWSTTAHETVSQLARVAGIQSHQDRSGQRQQRDAA